MDSQCNTQTRASMRSSRSFRNKPRSFDHKKKLILVSVYNKPPRHSRNYDTVEQAEVEASSKLRDYALCDVRPNSQKTEIPFRE